MSNYVRPAMAFKMTRNLLPEDTRIVEYIGSYSLLIIGFFLGIGAIECPPLASIQRVEFWVVTFLNFGLIQFISLLFYPKLEILRAIMSMVTSCTLLWLSLGLSNFHMMISDVPMFLIGLGNMYAFIINTVQIKTVWAK